MKNLTNRDYNGKLKHIERLLQVLDELRENCLWDKKQTMESLRILTIEEMYELADAILADDPQEIKKELGDVLLHIIFYSRIAEENDWFDIGEVCKAQVEKLIHRHPHIYGNTKVANEEEVKQNWEKLKLKEGNKSVLGGVPDSLPALVKAIRLQDKARMVGFDWDNRQQVMEKVKEEIGEFEEHVNNEQAKAEDLEDEFGDLLFSLVNYARFMDINPENALERTNRKFRKRFQQMEQQIKEQGLDMQHMTLEEMDAFWNKAKGKSI